MSPRILLVEDEPGLAMTLSDLLSAEGYAVESVGDGEAAVTKAGAEDFHLRILDLMLPKRTGSEVCRKLRQMGEDLAILMLTARSQVVDRVVGLRIGADDYLTKPFDPAEFAGQSGSAAAAGPERESHSGTDVCVRRRGGGFRTRRSGEGRAAREPGEQGVAAFAVPGGQQRPRGATRRDHAKGLGIQQRGIFADD